MAVHFKKRAFYVCQELERNIAEAKIATEEKLRKQQEIQEQKRKVREEREKLRRQEEEEERKRREKEEHEKKMVKHKVGKEKGCEEKPLNPTIWSTNA